MYLVQTCDDSGVVLEVEAPMIYARGLVNGGCLADVRLLLSPGICEVPRPVA